MKYEDIKGLSPEKIADKFALSQVPKYVCDCTLEVGTKLCTGECNPLYGRKAEVFNLVCGVSVQEILTMKEKSVNFLFNLAIFYI